MGGRPPGRPRRPPARPDEERARRKRRWPPSRAARSRCSSRPPSSRSASTSPNATVMVIEHAERFGLAQLHQLRGRVGRGTASSTCVLLAYGRLSEVARARLDVMVATEDGFAIAEKDLEIRGPGDFFGTRQWGMPTFRVAHLLRDRDLLERARDGGVPAGGRGRPAAAARPLPRRGGVGEAVRAGEGGLALLGARLAAAPRSAVSLFVASLSLPFLGRLRGKPAFLGALSRKGRERISSPGESRPDALVALVSSSPA